MLNRSYEALLLGFFFFFKLFHGLSPSMYVPLSHSSPFTPLLPLCCQVSDGDERVDCGGWELPGLPAALHCGQSSHLFCHHATLPSAAFHQGDRVELQVGNMNPLCLRLEKGTGCLSFKFKQQLPRSFGITSDHPPKKGKSTTINGADWFRQQSNTQQQCILNGRYRNIS